MIYFTSDLHFHHTNIMKYCPESRAIAEGSLDKMHDIIIDGINTRVGEKDTLYILGDVSFARTPQKIIDVLSLIKCRDMRLIAGNHDHGIANSPDVQSFFRTIKHYDEIRINKDKIILMHYPIESWNGMHHGSYMLHGHCHSRNDSLNTDFHRGKLKTYARRMDVGVDSRNDLLPWSWEEIKAFCNAREKTASYNQVMQQGI